MVGSRLVPSLWESNLLGSFCQDVDFLGQLPSSLGGTIRCCFSEKNIDLPFKVSYRLLEVKELLSSHHRWHRSRLTTRTVRNIVTKKGLLKNSWAGWARASSFVGSLYTIVEGRDFKCSHRATI